MKAQALAELAAFKSALAQQTTDAAVERERLAREERERRLFALSVGPVAPLRKPPIAPLPRARPAAVARQRIADEAAALRESLSDEFSVESLLETDDALSFRRPEISPEVLKKLRRGAWTLQAQLDLHGLRRDEARERLGAFLRDAVRQGLRCVRVVHGKGLGSPGGKPVLKDKVHSWLVQKSEVIAFVQARGSQGGHGAVVVLLRPGVHGGAASKSAMAEDDHRHGAADVPRTAPSRRQVLSDRSANPDDRS